MRRLRFPLVGLLVDCFSPVVHLDAGTAGCGFISDAIKEDNEVLFATHVCSLRRKGSAIGYRLPGP